MKDLWYDEARASCTIIHNHFPISALVPAPAPTQDEDQSPSRMGYPIGGFSHVIIGEMKQKDSIVNDDSRLNLELSMASSLDLNSSPSIEYIRK